jgi:hypothetical protein
MQDKKDKIINFENFFVIKPEINYKTIDINNVYCMSTKPNIKSEEEIKTKNEKKIENVK